MLNLNHAMINLDGTVQKQGIPLSFRDWLDPGSKNWLSTSDQQKAAAYQAAQADGWSDDGLIKILINFPHIEESDAQSAIDILKDLAKQHPFEINKKESEVNVKFQRNGETL